MLPLRKILCPIDSTEEAQEALNAAGELAVNFGAEVILLHVVPQVSVITTGPEAAVVNTPSYEQELVASSERSLREKIGHTAMKEAQTRVMVLLGDTTDEIVRVSQVEDVDLIVTATHARTGLGHLIFGSLAEKIVRLTDCPVLVIKMRTHETETKETLSAEEKKDKAEVEDRAVEEAVESQLSDLGARIDDLKAKLEDMKTQAKNKYKDQMVDLRAKGEDAQKKLSSLKESGGEAWEEVKVGLSQLWEALDRATAKFEEEKGSSGQEPPPDEKVSYEEQAEKELSESTSRINDLKRWVETSATEAKTIYAREVENLRAKQETAKKKLTELRESGGTAWDDVRKGMETALADLGKAIKEAAGRFTKP